MTSSIFVSRDSDKKYRRMGKTERQEIATALAKTVKEGVLAGKKASGVPDICRLRANGSLRVTYRQLEDAQIILHAGNHGQSDKFLRRYLDRGAFPNPSYIPFASSCMGKDALDMAHLAESEEPEPRCPGVSSSTGNETESETLPTPSLRDDASSRLLSSLSQFVEDGFLKCTPFFNELIEESRTDWMELLDQKLSAIKTEVTVHQQGLQATCLDVLERARGAEAGLTEMQSKYDAMASHEQCNKARVDELHTSMDAQQRQQGELVDQFAYLKQSLRHLSDIQQQLEQFEDRFSTAEERVAGLAIQMETIDIRQQELAGAQQESKLAMQDALDADTSQGAGSGIWARLRVALGRGLS